MAVLRHLFRMRPWLTLLLIASALMARGAVPAGWMPVVEATGITMMPCDGAGPAIAKPMRHGARGHDRGHPEGSHRDTQGEHPCAFAAVAQVADLATPPAALPLIAIEPAAVTAGVAASVGQGLAAPPPPATGPPASA